MPSPLRRRRRRLFLAALYLFLVALVVSPAPAQSPPEPESEPPPWTGKLADGTVIAAADLARILADHKKWLGTQEREGKCAYLNGADLNSVNLSWAHLTGASLADVNLHKANLNGADLYGANLSGANLSAAILDVANLRDADLTATNLSNASLFHATLNDATLLAANLEGADLTKADLGGADLNGANLAGVLLEPKHTALPFLPGIAAAEGLGYLTYKSSPAYLVALREAFKKAGYWQQEREIICALKRTAASRAWKNGGWGWFEGAFNYLAFDLTCEYGMNPRRCLLILFGFIFAFSPLYMLALRARNADTGIWLVWLPDRVLKEAGQDQPVKLTAHAFTQRKWLRILRLGLYFSLLSAFHIGWKELNVGNWITRIQKKEYTLRPTGWVRTVSGLQSLLSVYLLALWALSYFGRPFE